MQPNSATRKTGLDCSLAETMARLHAELRRMAAGFIRRERAGHTLDATGLVHEVFIRLSEQSDLKLDGRNHLFALASEAMRRILVEHARRRAALKRGKRFERVTLSLVATDNSNSKFDVLALDQALEKLAVEDPRAAQIVVLRFFGGMTVDATANVVGVSKRTAESDWTFARAWLYKTLKVA